MAKTRKVHSTGRFGSRYGVGIRKRVLKVETHQKEKQKCPDCNLGVLKRKAAGIYKCSKCKKEFAGGAYAPETMTGSLIKKIVSQKQFSLGFEELQPFEKGLNQNDQNNLFRKKVEQKTEEKEEKKESKKEKFLIKAKSVLGIQTFSKKFDQNNLFRKKVEQKSKQKPEQKKLLEKVSSKKEKEDKK